MISLSTHVLDTAHGCPASGVTLRLMEGQETLFEGVTDTDGRCPGLPTLASGVYSLRFSVATYFRSKGVTLSNPPFLDVIEIAFGIAGTDGHYHVPLLVAPFGYSTYRGS